MNELFVDRIRFDSSKHIVIVHMTKGNVSEWSFVHQATLNFSVLNNQIK